MSVLSPKFLTPGAGCSKCNHFVLVQFSIIIIIIIISIHTKSTNTEKNNEHNDTGYN